MRRNDDWANFINNTMHRWTTWKFYSFIRFNATTFVAGNFLSHFIVALLNIFNAINLLLTYEAFTFNLSATKMNFLFIKRNEKQWKIHERDFSRSTCVYFLSLPLSSSTCSSHSSSIHFHAIMSVSKCESVWITKKIIIRFSQRITHAPS
jgi:hypothetical protein